ncbi:MAG: elongation factor 4, partial [Patescibacteria group bacterium]
LSDSALSFEEDGSSTLGKGFRCGFLGMLHMEIVTERLRREHNIEPVITAPSITYEIKTKTETFRVHTASAFPNDGSVEHVREQWVSVTVMTPLDYLSSLTQLLYEHEGAIVGTEMFHSRMRLTVHMPLRELMRGFFDSLKSATSGYASLAYEFIDWQDAEVCRLDILVAEEEVPALSRIVSRRRLDTESRTLVERLKKELPRQQFVVKIQARADGRIVASESISAFKKDVTGYLYGGDVTRKMKLLEKQKKGKERRGEHKKMHIPQEVFLKLIKPED